MATRKIRIMSDKYVAARNFTGRATLMHKVETEYSMTRAICGQDMSPWSREYFDTPIEILYCKRCKFVELLKQTGSQSNVIKLRIQNL